MVKYDVAVIGGGFAGFAAAVAAARGGAKTILIEKTNSLGGAASWGLVQPFMCYGTKIDGKVTALSRGIFEQVCNEMKKMLLEIDGIEVKSSLVGRFDEEYLKVILNRMATYAGAELLFHCYVTKADVHDECIKSVTASSRNGSFEIEADRFIDASGDANLAYMCGCSYRLGRDDGLCQPMTLNFRLANVDAEVAKNLPKNEINALYKKLQNEGKIKNPREDVLMFLNYNEGFVHFNSTRVVKLNPTDPFDLTKAELMAREQVMELYLFMKNNIKGFENSRLVMSGSEIGVRESRMIDGEYILTGEDLKSCTQFEDSIALGNYDIDIHNPEGSGTSHYYFKDGEYYSIPYRSLIPKKMKNLLVAGRCISVDHDAQASIRIMPIVCTIGEAAGTAAALSLSDETDMRSVDITKLREALEKNGALTKL